MTDMQSQLFQVVQEYERAVIFRLGRLVSGGAKGPGKEIPFTSSSRLYLFYSFLVISCLTCNVCLFLNLSDFLNFKISLYCWNIYTTFFDQHWPSSNVSKIAGDTVVMPSVSSIIGVGPCLCSHRLYGDLLLLWHV
jgi:hypothetical protein